jgi:hypothetical protein
MRAPSDTDFTVPVPGVGTFTFGRRRMADEISIQVEYARLLDGVTATEWLALVCGWLAALKTLTVRAPSGWDIDEMDPLDDETYAKLAKVHNALTEKERSFRGKAGSAKQGAGQGNGQDGGVLVSAEVPPSAD